MGTVRYAVSDAIGVITIDRQEALNALNRQVLNELDAVLSRVDFDAVRVLIVTGAGEKAFVAGADIAQMKEMSKAQAARFGERGNEVFRRIELLPIPVIAAVNGFALGGGCELAMCCDFCVCSDNAVFGQPETGLGIIPGFGGTQRLARLVGSSRAKELIYAATTITAAEAERMGLVNHVFPQAELMTEVLKLARRIAANAPIAVRNAKRAINEGYDSPLDYAIQVEGQAFGDCFETHDQREGMTAFLERRKDKQFINR